jgi:hypothetical protein
MLGLDEVGVAVDNAHIDPRGVTPKPGVVLYLCVNVETDRRGRTIEVVWTAPDQPVKSLEFVGNLWHATPRTVRIKKTCRGTQAQTHIGQRIAERLLDAHVIVFRRGDEIVCMLEHEHFVVEARREVSRLAAYLDLE